MLFRFKIFPALFSGLFCCWLTSYGQTGPGTAPAGAPFDKITGFPSRFLEKLQQNTMGLKDRLTNQTEKYLQKMARREEKIRRRLYKLDSAAAKRMFENSPDQYAALTKKLRTDTGSNNLSFSGEYLPYADSLHGSLAFLQRHPQLAGGSSAQVQRSLHELQALQARMQDADQIGQFVRDRKEQLKQLLSQHNHLPAGLSKEYQGLNQDLYYYSQQVQEYRNLLNDPDKLAKKALALLNQLPAFQAFMKQNSQLAGLFGLPGNYSSPASLAGLQTRDQVSSLIRNQVSAAGPGGQSVLQSNLQSAQSQLDTYKDKLNKLGAGGADVDMPQFKPNDQKVKAFRKRLEYGANFQTSRNNQYFPTVADFGFSLGYKLGHSNSIGLGASYKMGLGNGWNHIVFSGQGVGLRSYLDVKLKGSFFLSGGFEYNYTTPFVSLRQLRLPDYWTKSGLIGISKTVSVRSRVFRKTKLSLLWDFLSYQQVPKTPAIVYRLGYVF